MRWHRFGWKAKQIGFWLFFSTPSLWLKSGVLASCLIRVWDVKQITEVCPHSPARAAIPAKSWCLRVLPQLLSFCLWSAKGRNGFKGSPLSDGADAVLKCGERLPWQKHPAHMSRAGKGTPETPKHETWFFFQQTCCPERQSGAGRRPKAQNSP